MNTEARHWASMSDLSPLWRSPLFPREQADKFE
jgi:hypothetical protein